MPAVAITDTGNLFGSLEFSQACLSRGVQPIIGCQIGLTRSDNPRLPPDCLVLLAQNQAGLANLHRLSSLGYLETDPGLKPQLTLDKAAEHAAVSHGAKVRLGKELGTIEAEVDSELAQDQALTGELA